MTVNWIEMAKILQDENLLIPIYQGDVASNEMYYQKSVLNVAIKNTENDILKHSKKKKKVMKKPPSRFIH